MYKSGFIVAFDVFPTDEKDSIIEKVSRLLKADPTVSEKETCTAGRPIERLWRTEMHLFLGRLRDEFGQTQYDYQTLDALVSKVWWAIYELENPPMLVLEIIASLKEEMLHAEDLCPKLSVVVNTLRSILKQQNGLASRLKMMQPAVVCLSALPDRDLIARTYQTHSEISKLRSQLLNIADVTKRWLEIGREFREIKLVKESLIGDHLLSVALIFRNMIVLRGCIDDFVDGLQALCSIQIHESNSEPSLVDRGLLPYPRHLLRIDFVNGVDEASRLIYTISVKIWLKYLLEYAFRKILELENEADKLRSAMMKSRGDAQTKRALDTAYQIHDKAIDIIKVSQSLRTLQSLLHEDLESMLKGKALEFPWASEFPVPPGYSWSYDSYLGWVGGSGSVTESLTREIIKALTKAFESIRRLEFQSRNLSSLVGSITDLSLSSNVKKLSSRLVWLTLILVILTAILILTSEQIIKLFSHTAGLA